MSQEELINAIAEIEREIAISVSYTHLTLPTIA